MTNESASQDTSKQKTTVPQASQQRETSSTTNPAAAHLDRTSACLPIVTGSIAFYLGKKADEFQTHQWTLYLRGPNNEDLSGVIAKVVFHLHASFAQPTRELTEGPYEVTERGWGEFEAQIRIIWKDSQEQPTVIAQPIKLYPPGTPANTIPSNDTNTPVVAETYDEVVFTEPTETFFHQLQHVRNAPTIKYSHDEHFLKYSDTNDMNVLLEAQKFLKHELEMAKSRLLDVDTELVRVDEALRQEEEQQQHKQQQQQRAAKKNRATVATGAAAGSAPKVNNRKSAGSSSTGVRTLGATSTKNAPGGVAVITQGASKKGKTNSSKAAPVSSASAS